MNTNPNLLDTSVIFNNTISIKEFEELFFNNERLPLFKSFLSKMIDSEIQPYDFFWNLSNKEGIVNSEGKWILDSEYKHYPIEMDMSFSYGYLYKDLIRIDLGILWLSFLNDVDVRNNVLSFSKEIALAVGSLNFIILPNEELEDYKHYTFYPSRIMSQLNKFRNIKEIVKDLNGNGIKEFDHKLATPNTFFLV